MSSRYQYFKTIHGLKQSAIRTGYSGSKVSMAVTGTCQDELCRKTQELRLKTVSKSKHPLKDKRNQEQRP
jgi:hypothetical protein